MRRRPAFWILLGVLALVGGGLFLSLRSKVSGLRSENSPSNVQRPTSKALSQTDRKSASPHVVSYDAEKAKEAERLMAEREKKTDRFKNRLSNTQSTIGQLGKKDHAILLANALFDTEKPVSLNIPGHMKSQGDPGSYIVQAKGPVDNAFREALRQAGALIISYIPNNAFLVRASGEVAQQLAGSPQTQIVLPYEPSYKLQTGLLEEAVNQRALPQGSILNVLLFGDAKDATINDLNNLGAQVLGQEKSSFGHVVKVLAPTDWIQVARLSGVQLVEMSHSRVRANDLSRVRLGVATDTITTSNYLGLTGQGVTVNVNDTAVDATHPDLSPRVFGDFAGSLVDSNGHGTHVAGIIASSGVQSPTVTNASGSINPGTNTQYRGVAPAANIFAISVDASESQVAFGSAASDMYLQETAANTNVFISNNSWHYFADNEYDLAAASYDAAVRDALPQVTGSRPLLYVFSAGNGGTGSDDGGGGTADTVFSPATAKNVLTVGAIEQFRNITNKTRIQQPRFDTNGNPVFTTNQPWLGMTDSSNQVASFSSRGNVGIGLEGDAGRFKPDVVAPGTFVVSTTEKDHWDQVSYYNPTNYHFNFQTDTVATNQLDQFSIFVPFNAVQMIISVFAPVDLPIYVRQAALPTTTTFDARGTNSVSLPPAHALTPVDTFWHYAIGNPTREPVPFIVETEIVTTNDLGDYFQVLSNMNNGLGPYYRYESGTSMSAGEVSGTLALMQQYFEQQLNQTNSPALMKALLINGARNVSDAYDFGVQSSLNFQGWGLINLTNTLPATNLNLSSGAPMLYFDQSPGNALATGQSRTYNVTVSDDAQGNPLRITLVWTDPPGNPLASVKLVNDLDLIVTNNDTGDVFFGNDIPSGSQFNFASDTNFPANLDFVNNVENVYLPPTVGSNYSITVVGHRVNVNAVTVNTNNVVQDYALVISSGDGDVAAALKLGNQAPPLVTTNLPLVTDITNAFAADPENFGGFILNQHVGANPALLGTNTLPLAQYRGQLTIGVTNQWHFYTVTNGAGFTNAAFLTFLPPTLSLPRMGTSQDDPNNASPAEADLDLYVSTNPDLTNLVPSVIAAADKSIGRGGTETVVLSNAVSGVYYVGVKSESAEAAEYGFLGVFSLEPFAVSDTEGNLLLRGFPRFAAIPDGTPDRPRGTEIFAVAPQNIQLKRVIVTNTISHQNMGDLLGTLRHSLLDVVLNNHSGPGSVTNQPFVYDDTGRLDTLNARHTDGPGSLTDYQGGQGAGQWMLTEVDNAPGHVGTNDNLTIFLERQQDPFADAGVTETLAAGECVDEFLFVPANATNLTVRGTLINGTGPVSMQVCPLGASGSDCKSTSIGAIGSTNSVVIDKTTDPPLNAGIYVIHLCNTATSGNATVNVRAFLFLDVNGVIPNLFTAAGQTPIKDDAVTYSTINVSTPVANDPLKIVSAEVGVRIDHPRVSDLVLTLVAPDGTRMLLDENRGAFTTRGMGTNLFTTNIVPVLTDGRAEAKTNIFDLGVVPTLFRVDWDFIVLPDWMHIYYGGNLIYDSGYRGGQGTFQTNLPGPPNQVVIVMNEGGNTNQPTTQWHYTVTSTTANYLYTTFTEDTNKTITPIKFAIPPFVPTNVNATTALSTFEGASGDYTNGMNVDGWLVTSNQVSAINDSSIAAVGSRSLALANGSLSRTLNTVPGRQYRLTYRYRGPGITAWYRGEGNPNDQVNGINGTVSPPVTYPAGEVGTAFSFNGSSANAVNLPDSPLLAYTRSFSLEGWFYVTNPVVSGPPAQMIIFRGDYRGGLDPYFLDVEPRSGFPNGCLQFGIEDNAGGAAFINSQAPVGGWTHFTATLEDVSGVMRLYTNGVLASQTVTGIRPLGPLDPNTLPGVGIGNHSSQPNPVWRYPFSGRIDECSFYQRALTPSEIRAIWLRGATGKFDPLTNAPANLAKMRISTAGITNVVYGQNTNWTTGTITFTATQSSYPLLVDGLQPGMLIDAFDINESGIQPYYILPEDPYALSGLTGMSALGNWQLEVWDNRAGPPPRLIPPNLLSWQLSFVFATAVPQPISLIHDQPVTNTIAPGEFRYYTVKVPSWASFATNILISASSPVRVWFNQATPPVGTGVGDTQLIPPAGTATSGSATLVTNGAPPLIRSSTYYIGIENPPTAPVSATVAFKVDFDVTPLTNGVPVPSISDPALERFFSYNVTNGETGIAVMLTNLNGNVDLVARKTPFPDLSTYDYGSFTVGSNDEDVLIYTNSEPALLSPGNWYFGVFNRTNVPVNYTIVAIDVPYIVTLTNAVAYTNTNPGGLFNTDYYRFNVSTNAVRAQFEILNPSADMTLVLRKGLPPPNLTTYSYISTNAGTSPEVITVFNYSTPVPLTPGDWFMSAVNVSGGPVTYAAMATEWPFYGTNIVITNIFTSSNNLCITWTSLPGAHYWVGGRVGILDPGWTNVSGTITATDYFATWCTPLPTPYNYFSVFEGYAPPGPGGPIAPPIASITPTSAGAFTLTWAAPAGDQYKVQWASSLVNPSWQTFTSTITSTNGTYRFTDDGAQTEGMGPARFYRILKQ